MKLNAKDQKICDKFSKRDEKGFVHCNECPLNKGNPQNYDFRCKANSFYDRHTKEWIYDNDVYVMNVEFNRMKGVQND